MKYFNSSFELGPIKELPILKQTTKILRISYPHNAIQKINPALSKAHNTEQLDFSYNQISIIEPIFQLKKLRILCLSHNQIANVPKGILKLKKLEVIDLTHNLLSFMPNINPLFQLYRIRKAQLQIMLEGNRVMSDHQSQVEDKIKKIKQEVQKTKEKIESKHQLKQLQISSKSMQMHKRTNSQPVSQEKTPSQIVPHAFKNQGSLSEAKQDIQVSMTSLNQYKRKFQVISASEFKGWSQSLNCLFRKEAESVKSLVQAYRHIISCLTTQFVNPSDATMKIQIGFIQASEIQELIKDQHSTMLEALSQSQEVPMTSYKIWVQLYRDLRGLAEKIRWEAWAVIQCEIRNQQIEALKLISPSKPQGNNFGKQSQLDGLLFSKNKQIESEQKVDCSQCFIKSEEVRQLRENVEVLTQENVVLKYKLQQLQKVNEKLAKQQNLLGQQLKRRQEQIIGAISEKIDASVYQKVLLQQAKGIQDLIKCDRHLLNREIKLFQNTQKLGDLCQTATALAKDKTITQCKEGVSQFYLQEQQKYTSNSGLIKVSYFNKNTENSLNYKKSKRNTQNSVSSTEKKRKFSLEKGQRNQFGSSNSRSSNLISRKTTEKLESQESPKKIDKKGTFQSKLIEKQSKIGEKTVFISDFAITETGKQTKYQVQQSNSRKALAELINRKTNENSKYFNMKNMKNNQVEGAVKEKIKSFDKNSMRDKINEEEKIEVQNFETYVPMDYHSVNLKDEEPYQKYMRFHLRNNILETLQRKGKRYSLSKLSTKLTSKQKQKQFLMEDSKKNSARVTERNLKSTQRIKMNQKQIRPQSNIKSYVEIIGKLRH